MQIKIIDLMECDFLTLNKVYDVVDYRTYGEGVERPLIYCDDGGIVGS